MGEKPKRQKRGSISEEDISTILQRYTATTILALLQEVAQVQDVKMDWNALAKQTTTGITNPREYQMLWRHLAYRHALPENLEDEADPLDDDSDLEYELEAFPPVSSEASTEAAACVKVLIASGSPSDSGLEKGLTIEAPLTINIPRGKSTRIPLENLQLTSSSMRGTNITVPVSVQKLPTLASAEGLDTNGCGSGNLPPRRKRKPWSAAEDMELFAAVQKCGEGNWANILKGDFKGDRTAAQLSHRWNSIKKRNGNSNIKSGSQLSEVHLAARRALNMALDKTGLDTLKSATSIGRMNSITTPNISIHPSASEPPSAQNSDSGVAGANRFPATQPPANPFTTGPDAVKAAAVAAGARIATQSAAAAILKAQLKGAIHIKTPPTATTRPSPGAHFYASVPPRANQGSVNVNPSTGPVVQSNQSPEKNLSSEVKASLVDDVQEDQDTILANKVSLDSLKDLIQGDQRAILVNAQRGMVKNENVDSLVHALKNQDQEEKSRASNNPPNGDVTEIEGSRDSKVNLPASEEKLEQKIESAVNLSSKGTTL